VMSQLKWRILDGVDPNPKNLVGCAVFQVEKGKTGCLLRLEPNVEQKVWFLVIEFLIA
jgi:AP-2 complex subunit alpha